MKCVQFQLQISSDQKAKEFLQRVDPRAPIPQAVEGGNGNGVLWQCILDSKKVDALVESLETNVRLYTQFYTIREEIDDSLYLPSNQVVWRLGKDPCIDKIEIVHGKERSDSCVIC
jgi:hypothetical protein